MPSSSALVEPVTWKKLSLMLLGTAVTAIFIPAFIIAISHVEGKDENFMIFCLILTSLLLLSFSLNLYWVYKARQTRLAFVALQKLPTEVQQQLLKSKSRNENALMESEEELLSPPPEFLSSRIQRKRTSSSSKKAPDEIMPQIRIPEEKEEPLNYKNLSEAESSASLYREMNRVMGRNEEIEENQNATDNDIMEMPENGF